MSTLEQKVRRFHVYQATASYAIWIPFWALWIRRHVASDFELTELGQPTEGGSPRLLARGRGCTSCDGTGFRGRVGLFEILTVTEEVRALVYDGASAKKIHRAAVAAGMQTLRDDGIRLCLDGITTAAEVQRILGADR